MKENFLSEEEKKLLEELEEELNKEYTAEGFRDLNRLLEIIACLLKKKVLIEKDGFLSLEGKLETIIDKLNTKIRLERAINDKLSTKISQQDTITGLLAQKVALETPQPPGVVCECRVIGTVTSQGEPNPAETAVLSINVCADCETTQGSTIVYDVFNPQDKSIRQVVAQSIETFDCDLEGGVVVISGQALIRPGVGGQPRPGEYELTLNLTENQVDSYTIEFDNRTDEIESITLGSITVESCPD